MSPTEKIEKAFDDAHVVIANYLQPGPRDAEESMAEIIRVLDDPDIFNAIMVLRKTEGRAPTLATV